MDHLEKLQELLLAAEWIEGLKLVYESFTTETILATLPMTYQLGHCVLLLRRLLEASESPIKRIGSFLRDWTSPYLVI